MVSTHSADKQPLIYSISYGFLGGAGHSRKLRRLLQQQGYKSATINSPIDIIIAHSAGTWLIPPNTTPKLVVYIGMPLNKSDPTKTFRQAHHGNVEAFLQARQPLKGLCVALCSAYYGLRHPYHNLHISRGASTAKPVIKPGARHIFIMNRDDPWPQSPQLVTYLAEQDWAFISLPGSHDNIWQHPEQYVAIINHYARLLD